jgi:hypothetical protein
VALSKSCCTIWSELLTVTDPAGLVSSVIPEPIVTPLYCVESEMVFEKLVLSVFCAVAVVVGVELL